MVKREEFNPFVKWQFSGNRGIIAENVRHQLSKVVKYNQLVANLAILNGVVAMTGALTEMQRERFPTDEETLAGLAPYLPNIAVNLERSSDCTNSELSPS